MLTAGFRHRLLGGLLSLTLAAPLTLHAQEHTALELLLRRGTLESFDSIQHLPATNRTPARLVLGDANGYVRVYEQRRDAWDEAWRSRHMEGGIVSIVIADVFEDGLDEIVVFTDQGRIYYLDSAVYNTLWSNTPGEYSRITAGTVATFKDDPKPKLVFVADGRLTIIDSQDRFVEWRSDQTTLSTTQILIADVDGDGQDDIVLNDGYVFGSRFGALKWHYASGFGERMMVMDLEGDGILNLVCEYRGRFVRIYDVNLRREK